MQRVQSVTPTEIAHACGNARMRAHTLDPVERHAIRWYRATWASRVTGLSNELAALADRCAADSTKPTALLVSRQIVFDVFAEAGISARERFAAAMVWGYGTVARGPARVEKILELAGDTF